MQLWEVINKLMNEGYEVSFRAVNVSHNHREKVIKIRADKYRPDDLRCEFVLDSRELEYRKDDQFLKGMVEIARELNVDLIDYPTQLTDGEIIQAFMRKKQCSR